MAVHVVTDSTADLAPALAAELGISVVPLLVHFGEEAYRDGVDLDAVAFLEQLQKSPVLPRTTQPSPAAFEEVYGRLLQSEDQVVSIHISAKLSGTLNSVLVAREGLGRQGAIEIVDSQWTSMALGIIVLRAAKVARDGGTLEEVVQVAQEAIQGMHLRFFCDTLEYLQRGGRIGRAAAFLGGLLNVKPLLAMEDGEIRPVERVRTRGRALARLREWAESFPQVREFGVFHTASGEDAQALRHSLSQRFPQAVSHFGHIGPVIATHVGPGVVGVAVLA